MLCHIVSSWLLCYCSYLHHLRLPCPLFGLPKCSQSSLCPLVAGHVHGSSLSSFPNFKHVYIRISDASSDHNYVRPEGWRLAITTGGYWNIVSSFITYNKNNHYLYFIILMESHNCPHCYHRPTPMCNNRAITFSSCNYVRLRQRFIFFNFCHGGGGSGPGSFGVWSSSSFFSINFWSNDSSTK